MKLAYLAAGAAMAATASGEIFFQEDFSNGLENWVQSSWKSDAGKFGISAGDWHTDAEADQGMETTEDLKFYGASAKLDKSFSSKGKDLVVQFSVANKKKESSFCAGGYIKLLPGDLDQEKFGGDSPYHIMFGPDMCGYDVSRIHAIFNFEGENLLKDEDIKLDYGDKNEFTHLYTLHVKPDNTYTVYFDLEEKSSGSLHENWGFPKKQIDDPTDTKPSDWVDEKMMVDPEDVKPEGYDDIPEKIADPDATKPDDWDDEDDGEWEAPEIDNPEFKGEWKPKMIENPAYKGVWKPKQIDNEKFVENVGFYEDIGAVGFELWVVNGGSIFDNIIVTDSLEEAKAYAEKTFSVTKAGEEAAKKAFDDAKKAEEEAAKEAAKVDEDVEEEDVEDDDEEDAKEEL